MSFEERHFEMLVKKLLLRDHEIGKKQKQLRPKRKILILRKEREGRILGGYGRSGQRREKIVKREVHGESVQPGALLTHNGI